MYVARRARMRARSRAARQRVEMNEIRRQGRREKDVWRRMEAVADAWIGRCSLGRLCGRSVEAPQDGLSLRLDAPRIR